MPVETEPKTQDVDQQESSNGGAEQPSQAGQETSGDAKTEAWLIYVLGPEVDP